MMDILTVLVKTFIYLFIKIYLYSVKQTEKSLSYNVAL